MAPEIPVLMNAFSLKECCAHASSEVAFTDGCEAVVGKDNREKVKPDDLREGGKFRAILKLKLHFETPAMESHVYVGTGWLIGNDLVATAGHNVFDKRMGNVKCCEVFVGYGLTPKTLVQRRLGTKAVVPCAWYLHEERVHDFAIIKLESPFDDVDPIAYKATPMIGQGLHIGVVGYPADKGDGEERGSEMYEEWAEVNWDIQKTNGLLSYCISTYGGNSGSPVLLEEDGNMVAIATHVSTGARLNWASPIKTDFANKYDAIIHHFFDGPWPKPDVVAHGMEYHCFSGLSSRSEHSLSLTDSDIHQRKDDLGLLLTVLFGAAIETANEICSRIIHGHEPEKFTDYPVDQHVAHAVLAEGALQFFFAQRERLASTVVDRVKQRYMELHPLEMPCVDTILPEVKGAAGLLFLLRGLPRQSSRSPELLCTTEEKPDEPLVKFRDHMFSLTPISRTGRYLLFSKRVQDENVDSCMTDLTRRAMLGRAALEVLMGSSQSFRENGLLGSMEETWKEVWPFVGTDPWGLLELAFKRFRERLLPDAH